MMAPKLISNIPFLCKYQVYLLEKCLMIRELPIAPNNPPIGMHPLSNPEATEGERSMLNILMMVSIGIVARYARE